jgi:hypothetical protein
MVRIKAHIPFRRFLLLSGSIGLLLSSCMDIRSYPDEPIITYKEFRYADTTLVFTFTDGDGNFGIPSGDSLPPFNYGSPYYYNLHVVFEEKVDTGFKAVEFEESEFLNMRIMDVPQPTGQNKTMRGKIEYNFHDVLGRDIVFPMPDTFRFTFYINDLDLNKSNVCTTPALSYPKEDSIPAGINQK